LNTKVEQHLMKEKAYQAQQLKDHTKSISEIHEAISLHKDQLKNIEASIASNKNESKNDISLFTVRLKTLEESFPPLNMRIYKLEEINYDCDFPNSLSTLVEQ
jgi:gas vesicle protein